MATPVDTIFSRFLSQIEDETWLEIDEEVLEELMFDYLKKSIVEFNVCKKDLTINLWKGEIESDLEEDEILIFCISNNLSQKHFNCLNKTIIIWEETTRPMT